MVRHSQHTVPPIERRADFDAKQKLLLIKIFSLARNLKARSGKGLSSSKTRGCKFFGFASDLAASEWRAPNFVESTSEKPVLIPPSLRLPLGARLHETCPNENEPAWDSAWIPGFRVPAAGAVLNRNTSKEFYFTFVLNHPRRPAPGSPTSRHPVVRVDPKTVEIAIFPLHFFLVTFRSSARLFPCSTFVRNTKSPARLYERRQDQLPRHVRPRRTGQLGH